MKKKFNTKQFNFGDSVKIDGEAYSAYDPEKANFRRVFREDYPPSKKVFGKICGISRLMVGTRDAGSYPSDRYEDDGEPSRFITKSVVYVWEVKITMMRKSVLCLPDQLCAVSEEDSKKIKFPIVDTWYPNIYKKELREEMTLWPRDDKGRWMKKTTLVTASSS